MIPRVDHVDLRVTDLELAKPFYRMLMPELGFTIEKEEGQWHWFQAEGSRPAPFFAFTEEATHRPNDNRIAFIAEDRAEVERVAQVVRQAGGKNIEGPDLCEEYAPGYFAVFFEDPSGNKLEVCYRPNSSS